ncbi:MAG: YraN family protein [Acidiferrobacterales bacterium]
MSQGRQQRGQRGEQIAVDYLKRLGYRIQLRNYRCRRGEIDIIAQDGPTLVFVEVKTKGQMAFGAPQAMVNRTKQHTMTYVAMSYVQQHHLRNAALRFDVVAITFLADGTPEVTHIPAAFSPSAHFFY